MMPGGQYVSTSRWRAGEAILATLFILAVALAIAGLVPSFLVHEAKQDAAALRGLVALATVQVVVVLLVLLAARRSGESILAALSMRGPPVAPLQLIKALAGLLAIVLPYALVVSIISPDSIMRDLQPFAAMLRSQWWWLVLLVVGIGAPVMEEVLFRGFLQSALARSRLGFLGASVLTTAAWTALHWGYSVAGLIVVFLVGLYFCWLLWRSGSLWLPLLCHGLYNAAIVLILLMISI